MENLSFSSVHLPETPHGFVLVGLAVIFFSGCVNKAQQSFERPPSPVEVTTAVSQDVPTYLDAIGKTVAREVVAIQPQVSGRITRIHFTDGANVKKGDLLFHDRHQTLRSESQTSPGQPCQSVALRKQAEANLARELLRQSGIGSG
jgi:multidrug efflux system membrane fusion protein